MARERLRIDEAGTIIAAIASTGPKQTLLYSCELDAATSLQARAHAEHRATFPLGQVASGSSRQIAYLNYG